MAAAAVLRGARLLARGCGAGTPRAQRCCASCGGPDSEVQKAQRAAEGPGQQPPTIFSKIIDRSVPAHILHEDDKVTVPGLPGRGPPGPGALPGGPQAPHPPAEPRGRGGRGALGAPAGGGQPDGEGGGTGGRLPSGDQRREARCPVRLPPAPARAGRAPDGLAPRLRAERGGAAADAAGWASPRLH